VISALGDEKKKGKVHVPYRDSKLTRMLQVESIACTLKGELTHMSTSKLLLTIFVVLNSCTGFVGGKLQNCDDLLCISCRQKL
jgi:hypothetical protein